MGGEGGEGGRGERGRTAAPGREAGEEVRGEEGDVLAPLAQGRDADGEDVEAVEEVLAEGALYGRSLEVAVGGRDHAHVDAHRARGADGAHLAELEGAQEAHLQRRRHLADLVEEDRAASGLLEEALLVRLRRR